MKKWKDLGPHDMNLTEVMKYIDSEAAMQSEENASYVWHTYTQLQIDDRCNALSLEKVARCEFRRHCLLFIFR